MRVSLRERDAHLTEIMDDPDCDDAALRRTYEAFRLVNPLVTGWHRSYALWIRPMLSRDVPLRLLDVGCGGGDLALSLARWAARDGLLLDVTGVDPDPRAIEVARLASRGPAGRRFATRHGGAETSIRFTQLRASDLESGSFDVVVSNHVLHHILDLDAFLAETAAVSSTTGLVLHSDLRRSRVTYDAFSAAMFPVFRDTFIRQDGLASIRRSYTSSELQASAPEGWKVVTQAPYRLLVRRGPADRSDHARGWRSRA